MSNSLIPFTIGGPTQIMGSTEHTTLQATAGAKYYPDDSFAHVLAGGVHYWFCSCGVGTLRTVGTLDDVAATSATKVLISLPSGFGYIGDGPVLVSTDGSWLMLCHTEAWGSSPGTQYWSCLYLCRSTDQGASWTVIGPAINPGFALPVPNSNITGAYDIGGGAPVRVGPWLYCYFIENPDSSQTSNYLAVARVDFATLCTQAAIGSVAAFSKYASGVWTTNALTGTADRLSGLATAWNDLQIDSQTGTMFQFLAGTTAVIGDGDSANVTRTISLTTSFDGIHWTAPDQILSVSSPACIFYPTPVFRDYVYERGGSGDLLLYSQTNAASNLFQSSTIVNRNPLTLHRGAPTTQHSRHRGGPACAVRR